MEKTALTKINQYLTFTLDQEQFAVEVTKVREVLEIIDITKVPRMPEFMLGVINLRGSVVPVMDLRLKFGLLKKEKHIDNCIIIMEITLGDEEVLLGGYVDSVHEVVELDMDQIEPAPKIGTKLDTAFIDGMGKKDDKFLIILNIDKVFSEEELISVQGGEALPTGEKTAEMKAENKEIQDSANME